MFCRALFSSGFPSPVTAAGKETASLTLPGRSKNLGVVSSGFWVPPCLLWESCGHFPAICPRVPWARGAMYWPPGRSRFGCGYVNAQGGIEHPALQGEALLPRTRLENSKLVMLLRSLFKCSIHGFGDGMCFFWNIGREQSWNTLWNRGNQVSATCVTWIWLRHRGHHFITCSTDSMITSQNEIVPCHARKWLFWAQFSC